MALTSGTRLGPYEILSPLGAGGMGEVWKARDTRLGRDVAIKLVHPRLAADAEQLRRFEQEARAASQLDHPNILVVHDVGTHEGSPFIVSELLQGESLRDRLGEPLPPKKAVEYALQVAHGLAAAHEKGIVHRDIKPENLFVTKDGRVKILDFGIAKLTQPAIPSVSLTEALTAAPATDAGVVIGTVGYMSPEQVLGKPLDARSDLFSLGVVLYEIFSGKRPFQKDTAPETMAAILKEEPAELSGVDKPVPPGLDRIVRHCIEKEPTTRFQTAQDLGFALEDLSRQLAARPPGHPAAARPFPRAVWIAVAIAALVALAAALPWLRGRAPSSLPEAKLNPKRILVIPFENVTGDPSLDAVGRMTADWISQGLLQTEQVEVVTLGVGPGAMGASGRREKAGKGPDALEAQAVENGAGTVVSGAYYASGKDLEFQARLTDAAAGKMLFALEPVRGPREQPMQVIDRVRQRMMGAVVTQFGLPGVAAVIQKPPLYEAYVEYMAGFEFIGFDNEKTRQHLERAVALDPDFIVARIRLASVYSFLGDTARSEALFAKLRESTERMTPAERLLLDIQVAMIGGKLIEGYQASRNLHALVPRDTVALLHHARHALWTNRSRECLDSLAGMGPWEAVLKEASGRYRQLTWYVRAATQAHHLLGEHEKELAVARLGLTQFPDMLTMHLGVVSALAALGRTAELDQALEASLSVPPRGTLTPGEVMLGAAEELRVHGHRDVALKVALRAAEWFVARLAEAPAKERLAAGRLQALCLSERWDEAGSAAAKFAAAFPDLADATGHRGVLAARASDRPGAEEASASLSRVQKLDARRDATYWRACIAAQLGDKDRAVDLLREAFKLGEPIILSAHADWRLDPLRGYPPFEELLIPKG